MEIASVHGLSVGVNVLQSLGHSLMRGFESSQNLEAESGLGSLELLLGDLSSEGLELSGGLVEEALSLMAVG